MRYDGRDFDQIRAVKITPDFIKNAAGSVLIESGNTRVICTASVEEKVPPFLEYKHQGWLTAEYGMLPASTPLRKDRERNKADSRSLEIQRLIGRALRSAVDMAKLGKRTVKIDCDVIDADGGTRTASITGAYVALRLAVDKMMKSGLIADDPIINQVAAISVGIVNNAPVTDLCYHEDNGAEVDMNVVLTASGDFIEIQGTGEGRPFTAEENAELLRLAKAGAEELFKIQNEALSSNGVGA